MKSKIKIMNPKPQVSDEEIRSFMDFEGLLQRRNVIVQKKQILLKSGAALLVLTVVVTAFLLFNSSEKPSTMLSSRDSAAMSLPPFTPPDTSPQVARGEPEINKDGSHEEVTQHLPSKDQERPTHEPKSKKMTPEETGSPESNKDIAESSPTPEKIYVQAEPVQGYERLFAFFRENLTYPQVAIKDSVQGVMKISFVIDENGKPVNIRIEETLGAPFDEEAVKLIESMPLWKPALLNDKPVKSRISLPLTFEIKKVNH